MPTTLPLRVSTPRALLPAGAFSAFAASLLIVVTLACTVLPIARLRPSGAAGGGSCGLSEAPCALLAP